MDIIKNFVIKHASMLGVCLLAGVYYIGHRIGNSVGFDRGFQKGAELEAQVTGIGLRHAFRDEPDSYNMAREQINAAIDVVNYEFDGGDKMPMQPIK